MADMTIQTLRQQYPQYSDMSDFQLANAIHQKFYSDMPVNKVYEKLGVGAGYQDENGQYTPIQNAGKPMEGPEGSISKGLVQGAYNVARQAVETPISGIAQIGAMATGNDPDAARNAVMNFGNWQSTKPRQEATNQAVQSAIGGLMSLPQNLLDKGIDLAGKGINSIPGSSQFINQHPALVKAGAAIQGIGDFGVNAAPIIAGGIKAFQSPEGAASNLTQNADISPAAQAINTGYKIPPSDAMVKGGNAPIGRVLEGLTSSDKLKVAASVKNQGVTNRLAAQSLGLSPDTVLTPEALDAARAPAEAVYQQMGQLGKIPVDKQFKTDMQGVLPKPSSIPARQTGINADIADLVNGYKMSSFDAGDALEEIKNLRSQARGNYIASKAPTVKNGADLSRLADAQNKVADALLNQVDRFAASRPEGFDVSNLGQQFRDARTQLAKVHSVEDSITPGTTDVSAKVLAKQMNNRKVTLSGPLKQIADTYNNFPLSLRESGPLRQKVPVNMFEGAMGGGGLLLSDIANNPTNLSHLAELMTLRPIIRQGLLSGIYQNGMIPHVTSPLLGNMKPYIGLNAAMAGNNPLLNGGK